MIAARIARRSLMDCLLLDGMEWTDARPWFGMTGLGVVILIAGIMEGILP
jgi:hypothetical protein